MTTAVQSNVRWGDKTTVTFTATGAGLFAGVLKPGEASQLVNVPSLAGRPRTFNIILSISLSSGTLAGGETMLGAFRLVYGIGSAQIEDFRALAIVGAAIPGALTQIIIPNVPAETLQVKLEFPQTQVTVAGAKTLSATLQAGAAPFDGGT